MINTNIIRRKKSDQSLDMPGLHPLLKRIYEGRGVLESQALESSLKNLLPYTHLKQIDLAVCRLYQALLRQEKVIIVGDFDADGATSTALAVTALKKFGLENIGFLVPNRFEFGYGLSAELVDVAAKKEPALIITVDNGIGNHQGVSRANEYGIDVIITDHHLAGSTLPDAYAIVNPNQPGDQFPSKAIAGVGVIFYVILAFRGKLRDENWFVNQNIPEPNMADFLDLVALGTIADVVPLDKNNRILVTQGLKRIRAGLVRPGIQALFKVANCEASTVVTSDLAYTVAPRLNAAGRLEDMSIGIQGLMSDNESEAIEIASTLDALNRERKSIEQTMKIQAWEILKKIHVNLDKNLPVGFCLYQSDWHQGVIGILAARIKEKTHRPVIIFARGNDRELKGSARSIQGLHIRDILASIDVQYPGLIKKYGGHAMAAGLTISEKDVEDFREIFTAIVAQFVKEHDLDLRGKIYSDGQLGADELNIHVAELLRYASPWGQGFPEPLFDNVFELLDQQIVGKKHLKLILRLSKVKSHINAILFNFDEDKWPNYRASQVHAAYRLGINRFNGYARVQLIIEHLISV